MSITPTKRTRQLIDNLANANHAMDVARRAGMVKATNIFRMQAVEGAPIDKGTLRKSILTEVSNDGTQGKIYTKLDYALHQEHGTGIYGKSGAPIRPKKAKALRFKTKSGKVVFAKQVRGVKAKKFFAKAGVHLKGKHKDVFAEITDVLRRELAR